MSRHCFDVVDDVATLKLVSSHLQPCSDVDVATLVIECRDIVNLVFHFFQPMSRLSLSDVTTLL